MRQHDVNGGGGRKGRRGESITDAFMEGSIQGSGTSITADIRAAHHVNAFVDEVEVSGGFEAAAGDVQTIIDVKVNLVNHAPHFLELID